MNVDTPLPLTITSNRPTIPRPDSNSEEVSPLRSQHGPGPELDSNDLQLQPIYLLPFQSAFSMSSQLMVRTSEPDNGDCAQPDQRRRSYDDLSLLETNTVQDASTVQDNATIYTARTGTDTLDTDKTWQRGSLSKKPSPDDPGIKPYINRVLTIPNPPEGASAHDGNNSNPEMLRYWPCSLSFPSPPSVQDEEWPTRDTASGNASNSHEGEQEHPIGNSNNSSHTLSSGNPSQEGNANKTLINSGKIHPPGPKRKQKRILMGVAILVLLVVLAIILGLLLPKDKKTTANVDATIVVPSSPAPSPILPSAVPTFAPTDIDLDIDIVANSGNGPDGISEVLGNETMTNVSSTTSTLGSASPSNATILFDANVTEGAFTLGNTSATSNATAQAPADAQSLRGTSR
jgi:hypothetical protein